MEIDAIKMKEIEKFKFKWEWWAKKNGKTCL